jgi:hypothetical protein
LQQKKIQGLKPKNRELTGTKIMIKPVKNKKEQTECQKPLASKCFYSFPKCPLMLFNIEL